jgi:hypothetical protein
VLDVLSFEWKTGVDDRLVLELLDAAAIGVSDGNIVDQCPGIRSRQNE